MIRKTYPYAHQLHGVGDPPHGTFACEPQQDIFGGEGGRSHRREIDFQRQNPGPYSLLGYALLFACLS